MTTDVGNRVLKYDDEILLDVKVMGLINCSAPVMILVFIYIFVYMCQDKPSLPLIKLLIMKLLSYKLKYSLWLFHVL